MFTLQIFAVCCRNRKFIKVQFACYRHRFHLYSHLMWMIRRRYELGYSKMWSEGPQRDGMCGESVGNGRPCGLGHLGRSRPGASAFIPGSPGSVQLIRLWERLVDPQGYWKSVEDPRRSKPLPSPLNIYIAPTEILRKEAFQISLAVWTCPYTVLLLWASAMLLTCLKT